MGWVQCIKLIKSLIKFFMVCSLFLDALLADLQNTVSPGATNIGGSTSGYGSLNKTRQSPARESPISRSDSYTSKSVSKIQQ